MIDIPKQTGDIFDLLSKGQFICSNSSNDITRKLYDITDEHFEELHEYFAAIGFILEKGDEYYYFSKVEPKADLERKITIAFKWIDIVDFLKTFDVSFSPGFRFTPSDILVRIQIDAVLKTKVEGLKRYTKEDAVQPNVQKMIDMLCSDGYAELENEISAQYKVLASFHYLEQLILKINIPEEVQHAIPQ
jgi:hypothetical protein